MKYFMFIMALSCHMACQSQHTKVAFEKTSAGTFGNYWYSGKAELNSYALQQMRYGELHDGEIVMVFVTEDFSTTKQVKADYPSKDAVKVLKLNQVREFNTGVYSYNMMNSVFTPVDASGTIKVSMTSQDWCGHSFNQLNKTDDGYRHTQFSYFESEGDVSSTIDNALLEDEVLTLIRLNPAALPTGKVRIVPSLFFNRLRHQPLKVEAATVMMTEHDNTIHYTIRYSSIEREVKVVFEKSFPHKLLALEESHMNGFGSKAQYMTTKATLKKTILSPYWEKHNNRHKQMREALELAY